jgi:predicted RNA-binding Zn ribbon-like protein
MQRPHVGEPLALDLVNTRWMSRGSQVDFLEDEQNVRTWLAENGFSEPSQEAWPALLEARDALRASLVGSRPEAERALNAVLEHGAVRLAVHDGRPERTVRAESGWLAAWTAVSQYLDLIEGQADRVRQCAHPDCVLFFHDTSRNGTRRWHSMETCGARSKAQRHYRRVQGRDAEADA